MFVLLLQDWTDSTIDITYLDHYGVPLFLAVFRTILSKLNGRPVESVHLGAILEVVCCWEGLLDTSKQLIYVLVAPNLHWQTKNVLYLYTVILTQLVITQLTGQMFT